jgi:uncharacterized membrane protein
LTVRTFYHGIAGQSLDRLAALSDGIFAVAMTLLVLDLRVPVSQILHTQVPLWAGGALPSERPLLDVLLHLAPSLLTYLMSFLTLGIFWIGQQTQLNHFSRSDRHLTWIHLVFLMGIALMPFSTALLAEFITYRLAIVVYWLELLLLGATLLASIRYAKRAGLLRQDTGDIGSANERRIIVYQAIYAVGALLCVIDTYVSIAFIVLVQLNSAIAPRIWPLDRF